jgi:Pyruvate/2-oxoacid:ferredoxin oxidoreductase delta subunit
MAKQVRQIIKIDEEKCNGCGACVPACAEGALQVIDGKARLVSETYCDGLGACLGECPQDAISFETREADAFDEAAATEHAAESGKPVHAHAHDHVAHSHGHGGFVCPSAKTIDRTRDAQVPQSATGEIASELRQWPVKLYLVNPSASYFANADLLISADCVPFAYGGLHPDFLRGRVLVTGCPKFDDVEVYVEKLSEIIALNNIRRITVLQMEVPCCSGLQRLAEHVIDQSGKSIPIEVVTISLAGEVKSACPSFDTLRSQD